MMQQQGGHDGFDLIAVGGQVWPAVSELVV